MTKHVFIINPKSGAGKYKKIVKLIDEHFDGLPLEYEVRTTAYAGHATEIAREYHGKVVLYSVGGDGTAHEIVNGINPEVEMAIIPVGTGNDFWRMINFEGSLKEILYKTILGSSTLIDLGVMNGTRFLNFVSFGFDAHIQDTVNKDNKFYIPRSVIYLATGLQEVFGFEAQSVTIELDGEKKPYNLLMASFMNGKWYGGGFKSAPQSNLSSGHLDVCLVDRLSTSKLLSLIPRYMKGTHLKSKGVAYHRVKEIRIQSKEKIIIAIDGELVELNDVKISVEPQVLKLRIPYGARLEV